MSAPRTSHLLGSSGFAGSSASLSSLASSASTVIPVPSPNGGPIVATGNIINQKADASRSLYQICISLKSRLSQVPEFQPFLDTLDPSDPVDPLWNLFRTGYPLLLIYNALNPENKLKVEDNNASEAKKSKIAIFKFIQACMKDLKLSPADTFVITDLMGNDTTGFVKVIPHRHGFYSTQSSSLTQRRLPKLLTTCLTSLRPAATSSSLWPLTEMLSPLWPAPR